MAIPGGASSQSTPPASAGQPPAPADPPVFPSCGACGYRKKYAFSNVHYFKDCIIVKNRNQCPSALEPGNASYSPVQCTKDGCDCHELYVAPAAPPCAFAAVSWSQSSFFVAVGCRGRVLLSLRLFTTATPYLMRPLDILPMLVDHGPDRVVFFD